jgi:fatty acid desaturase
MGTYLWAARRLSLSNLGTSCLTSFVYGGQNFHIEPHLFPAMPRNNARRAAPIVQAFCRKHSLPYHTVSVRTAFVELLRT